MTSRILALAGAFLLAACASREGEPPGAADLASTPSKPPGLGEVPVTFSGLLPCAECAGEQLVVTFFPDGSFRLRSTFQDDTGTGVGVYHDLGRWTRDADQALWLDNAAGAPRVFRELSPGVLEVLDGEGGQAAGAPLPELRLQPAIDRVEGPMPLRGMYTYFADAALLEECHTGRRFPVVIDGAHLELERAYLENRPGPGEPLLVTLEGRFELREPEPGAPAREHVRVVEFEEVWPGQSCDEPREPTVPPDG